MIEIYKTHFVFEYRKIYHFLDAEIVMKTVKYLHSLDVDELISVIGFYSFSKKNMDYQNKF